MHDRLVRNIAVSKDDLVNGKLPDQVNEFIFGKNRDTIGVEWARQHGRIGASFDIWNLRRGKGDNLAGQVIAKDKIEIVEISARRAHDENSELQSENLALQTALIVANPVRIRLLRPLLRPSERKGENARMLEVIKPVAAEATNTMKDLQDTAQNLNRLTDENSELNLALTQFKTFGEHLSGLTAPDSALSQSLTNIEKISTRLTENDNIEVTLRNLRTSSERLKIATNELHPAGENIKQFSETIKTQPWRLIWPATKISRSIAHARGSHEKDQSLFAKQRKQNRVPARLPATRTSSR